MVPVIVLVILLRISDTFQTTEFCKNVVTACLLKPGESFTWCYEDKISTCLQGRFAMPNFIHEQVSTSQQVERNLTQHRVSIPLSALQSSQSEDRAMAGNKTLLVITLLNSTHFRRNVTLKSKMLPRHPESHGNIVGGLVLMVKVGQKAVSNLSQPILLVFKHNHMADNGTCVFWKEVQRGNGHWSREGCYTSVGKDGYLCSCDHLSFFAVLVNPKVSLDGTTKVNLSYISTGGSALSVICSLLSLIIYTCLQNRRPDKSIGVHMQLTGAILCLHLSFLLGCLWAWLEGGGWACKVFGALLHWSLLGTFTWTAIEGFHLYILLVRVFNIYIRKYLLKLSLVGWGVPTVIVVTCGFLDVYGEYTPVITDHDSNTTSKICWIKDMNTDGIPAIYILMLTYMGLVLLFNSAMLALVVVKIWTVRSTSMGFRRGMSSSNNKWKLMDKEKRSRMCKDLATVMGLSCVLGLAWSFSYTTYSSLSAAGLYLFTILNSLQGVFMFLWSLALTCKSRSENHSSAQDASTKKTMETSFNS
ncbi:unnamed protein product [Lota lota]